MQAVPPSLPTAHQRGYCCNLSPAPGKGGKPARASRGGRTPHRMQQSGDGVGMATAQRWCAPRPPLAPQYWPMRRSSTLPRCDGAGGPTLYPAVRDNREWEKQGWMLKYCRVQQGRWVSCGWERWGLISVMVPPATCSNSAKTQRLTCRWLVPCRCCLHQPCGPSSDRLLGCWSPCWQPCAPHARSWWVSPVGEGLAMGALLAKCSCRPAGLTPQWEVSCSGCSHSREQLYSHFFAPLLVPLHHSLPQRATLRPSRTGWMEQAEMVFSLLAADQWFAAYL